MQAAKKGGLGANKIKTNFADIEQRANMADQQIVPERKVSKEKEEEAFQSVMLSYKSLSMEANQKEEKLKKIDPAKAKQMERLGMGFNLRS